MAIVALWLALLVRIEYGGDWSALFCVGESTPMPEDLASVYRWKGAGGYDGQYYRLMAHDPLLLRGYSRYMDSARLRYRRILLPALAFAAGLGQPGWIDRAYILVEIAVAGLGVWWSAAYVAARGLNPAWGLCFLLAAGPMTSYDRMLVDGLLTALFMGFLLYSESGEWRKVWVVIALAALTRETGVLLVAGAVAHWLWRRNFRQAAFMAAAAGPALLWYAFVWTQVGSGMAMPRVFQQPLVALFRTMEALLGDPSYPPRMLLIDALALAAMPISAVVALWSARREPPAVAVTIALFAMLALMAGSRRYLSESYGYARPIAPMLAYLLFRGIGCRAPLLAAPSLAISASLAARVFVRPFLT
jgi:hypothetical protein